MKSARLYLQDILDYIALVERFTVGGRDEFLQDEKTQFAVIRAYEIIGEIAKRLPQEICDTSPQIDWRKLIGFRDFLAHNYEEIILEFVWAAVKDVANLKAAIEALLATLPDETD